MAMRFRSGEDPRAAGRRFEKLFAKLFGVEPTKGSGNSWMCKMDVGDGSITFSCKWTSNRTFTITKEALREVEEGVFKNGDNSIPAMAIAIDSGSDIIVAMRADDLLRLLSSDAAKYITPSKASQKRARASVPGILRDASESS